jgi:outer membrane receptor for ferrienterochelin and colicins
MLRTVQDQHDESTMTYFHPRPLAGLVALAALPASAQTFQPALPSDQPPAAVQTIVVSATRHAMAMIEAPAAMTVVTREQIEQRGSDNVLDALRGETGVSVAGRTISGRRVLSLRGMDSRHTLILMDGKRIAASDGLIGHSDFQGDWIPMEDIERIEVIRGPMSVLYGAEALGGVVNIITRPTGKQWAFSALAEGTQASGARGGDGHRVAVRAAGPLADAWRLALTAADVRRQRIDGAADPLISDLEGRHKQDVGVQLTWLPSQGHKLELEHRAGQEQRAAGARERSGARRYYDSISDIDRSHTSLGWNADWGGAQEWRTQLRAYESSLEMTNLRTNGVAALRPNKPSDRVVEGQASFVPFSGHLLTGGFEARNEQLVNSSLTGGEGSVRHRAAYLQDEFQLDKTLTITAGLRRDDHSMFGSEWSPRAYAVWHVAPQWTVKGGIGHGFKAPTLKQITPGYAEDEGPNTFFANPALRPETNDAAEIGVGWESPSAGVQLMVFTNRVNDLIVNKALGVVAGRATYTFQNVDSARLQGAEVSTVVALGVGFKAGLNYQYLDAKDGKGQRLEKRPRHTIGLRLDWERGPWSAGVRIDSSRDQLLASLVPGQPLQAVPNITLVGLQAAWKFAPGLELGVGVDNATDVRLSSLSPLFIYSEPPRTYRVSLRGRW